MAKLRTPTFSRVLRFFVQLWRTCVPERNVRPVLLHRFLDEVTLRTGVSRKKGLPLASFCADRWFASSAFGEGLPRIIFSALGEDCPGCKQYGSVSCWDSVWLRLWCDSRDGFTQLSRSSSNLSFPSSTWKCHSVMAITLV